MNFEYIPELAWANGYTEYFWGVAGGLLAASLAFTLGIGLLRLPGQRRLLKLAERLLGLGPRGKRRKRKLKKA